jgi:hypothetical protein
VYERLYRAGLVVAERGKYRLRCPLVGVLAEQAGPRQPAFWAGGIVSEGSIRVKRPADDELLAALRAGEYCYILAPRQAGKSTLAAATASRLRKEGVACAFFDLNLSGSDCEESEWYADLVQSVSRSLGVPQVAEWRTPTGQPGDEAWLAFLRECLLTKMEKPIVIFLDEIDWLRELPFGERFFRSVYRLPQLRDQFPPLARLTFCLLGVTPLEDLVPPATFGPFAWIREIWLRDFLPEESQAFAEPLKHYVGGEAAGLLEAILAWAGGNPYMIQRLCKELTQVPPPSTALSRIERVDQLVDDMFLRAGPDHDLNLAYTERCFTPPIANPRALELLDRYEQVLTKPQSSNGAFPTGGDQRLCLTGITTSVPAPEGEWLLRTRNRVFSQVFDGAWVRRKREQLSRYGY